MLNIVLRDKETGIEFQVVKKIGGMLVLKTIGTENKKTIRRPERTIMESFEVVKDVEPQKIKTPTKKRESRDGLNLKRVKKISVDVEAIELKARTKLQDVEDESDDIQNLEFDYNIGLELKVVFTAIKLLPNGGRVDYMIQKLQSDDEWAKLMFYCWKNRKVLRSVIRWDELEDIAINHLGSGNKPTHLISSKVTSILDKLIQHQIDHGVINFKYYTDLVEALPDGHDSETSYYLFAISTLLFSKSEWGSMGLNRHLIEMCESSTL